MRYFIFSLHDDTYGKLLGPFNTHERALAYMKKHHVFGKIIEKRVDK